MAAPISERFWAKADKGWGDWQCWFWKAAVDKDGYGCFQVGVGVMQRAHRWAWEEANGPIPTGMVICHSCDNPPCVNPGHLFLGTLESNIADRDAKGRQGRRARHYNARLTEVQVDEMRRRRARGESAAALGREFDISYSHAKNILSGKRWR